MPHVAAAARPQVISCGGLPQVWHTPRAEQAGSTTHPRALSVCGRHLSTPSLPPVPRFLSCLFLHMPHVATAARLGRPLAGELRNSAGRRVKDALRPGTMASKRKNEPKGAMAQRLADDSRWPLEECMRMTQEEIKDKLRALGLWPRMKLSSEEVNERKAEKEAVKAEKEAAAAAGLQFTAAGQVVPFKQQTTYMTADGVESHHHLGISKFGAQKALRARVARADQTAPRRLPTQLDLESASLRSCARVRTATWDATPASQGLAGHSARISAQPINPGLQWAARVASQASSRQARLRSNLHRKTASSPWSEKREGGQRGRSRRPPHRTPHSTAPPVQLGRASEKPGVWGSGATSPG